MAQQGRMGPGTVAFLAGILVLLWSKELPDSTWLQFLPIGLLLALFHPAWRLPVFFLTGFLWALFRAELLTTTALISELEGRDLVLNGVIASIPKPFSRGVRFEFKVDGIELDGEPRHGPKRVRLSWYGPPTVHAGERWLLTVRLKRPHGFSNKGGFDYERWLFQRGIRATGYVRGKSENRRLEAAPHYSLLRLRERLGSLIDETLRGYPSAGVVQALAIGLRNGIDDDQWQVFRATGTGHLMAISGLHIGLVAGIVFFLGRRVWSLSSHLTLHMAAPRAAALMVILAAVLYAGLAGFALPTRRALVMVASLMLAIYVGGVATPSRNLLLALLVVLVVDPLSVLSAGFWLSFGAVLVILLGMGGRLSARGPWWRWGRVHWIVAVGLLPSTLVFFGESPWVSPLANLVAVPWMSLIVVPLTLLGTLLIVPLPGLGEWLLIAAALAAEWLWPVLDWLASLELIYRPPAVERLWLVLAAGVGVLVLLLPRGFPSRWLGLLWLAPVILVATPAPGPGAFTLTVLDVGQGLATVVRTARHVLVYDTGPRFSPTFDVGRAVLIPYLHAEGIRKVDRLIVSHGDNDHAGGADSLLQGIPVEQLLTSVSRRWPTAVPCRRGQTWRWDGVEFQILHPDRPGLGEGNDGSCVLRIASDEATILLPGDIEFGTEKKLTRSYGAKLQADILVAPHHGSKTSSSPEFLDAVLPTDVLFSVGYRNRFGFPAEIVEARYRERGIRTHYTAHHGAVRISMPGNGEPPSISRYRPETARFWNWTPDEEAKGQR